MIGSKNTIFYIGAPFLLTSVIFILGVSFGIPLNDEWRWMKELLIPLLNGEITFDQYILGEYSLLSHSHFLALLFLWIDYHLFNLDFLYFSYVGLVFYALGYLLILWYIKQFLQGNVWIDMAAIIVISIGYFCITSDFAWLLVMFEYVYFFLAIWMLIAMDMFVRQRISFFSLLLIALICLLLGDTIGMAAVFVCGAAFFVYSLVKFSNIKYFVVFTFVIAAFFFLQFWFLGKGLPLGDHSRMDAINAIINSPVDILISFLSIFSQPLIDITIFRSLVGEKLAPVLQLGLGFLGFIFIGAITTIYFYAKGWRQSWLPMLFIAYGCLCWLLIFISRYSYFGVDVMNEPRYVRLLTLIYIGGGMALLFVRPHFFAKRLCVSAVFLLLMIYIGTIKYKFWQDQYIESYFVDAKRELQKEPIDSSALSVYIGRCEQYYCTDVVDFMRKNYLSIFKVSAADR